jgi:hypothetical protein
MTPPRQFASVNKNLDRTISGVEKLLGHTKSPFVSSKTNVRDGEVGEELAREQRRLRMRKDEELKIVRELLVHAKVRLDTI